MTIPYNLGIPLDTHSPIVDQPNMKTNNDNIAAFVAIDHVGFNSVAAPNGFHNKSSYALQAIDPAAVNGTDIVYSKDVNYGGGHIDQELFVRMAADNSDNPGAIIQLTQPNIGFSAATNGYTFLPGGIIMQWGFNDFSPAGIPGQTGTIPFNVAFPNACFVVLPILQSKTPNTSNAGTLSVLRGSVSTAQFQWNFSGGATGSYLGIYWQAIGN